MDTVADGKDQVAAAAAAADNDDSTESQLCLIMCFMNC